MTARVITDPSALGWVLDPSTGRWEWSGSGDGGGSGGGGGSEWELVEAVDMSGASAYEYYGFELGVKQYRLSIPFAYSPDQYRYRIAIYEDMQDSMVDLGKRFTETRMWPDPAVAINPDGQTIDLPFSSGLSGDSRSEVIFSGMHNTSANRGLRVTYECWQGDKYSNAGFLMTPDTGKQFNGFRVTMGKGPAPIDSEARLYKLVERN